MRERQPPVDTRQSVSYLSVGDDALMRRVRDSRVVILRAVCDGRWDKTRVAILENTKEADRCRHSVVEVDVAMKLSEFYMSIRPGRSVVFHDERSVAGADPADIIFSGGPIIHESAKAIFRVDIIACNERFNKKDPLSEGPARDME